MRKTYLDIARKAAKHRPKTFDDLKFTLTIDGFADVTLSNVNIACKYFKWLIINQWNHWFTVCMHTIVKYFLLALVDLAPCGGLLNRHTLHVWVPVNRIIPWRLRRQFVDLVLYATAEDAAAFTVWRLNTTESLTKMTSPFFSFIYKVLNSYWSLLIDKLLTIFSFGISISTRK